MHSSALNEGERSDRDELTRSRDEIRVKIRIKVCMEDFVATEFGMREKLGSVEGNSQISPETRQVIDAEVQRLVTEQYDCAQALQKDHHAARKTLAQQLLKQKTVSGSVVKEALENSPSPGAKEPKKTELPLSILISCRWSENHGWHILPSTGCSR